MINERLGREFPSISCIDAAIKSSFSSPGYCQFGLPEFLIIQIERRDEA